ncbi:hypothetical protein HELRODRAFT_191074 [Helobdella robusta]|uniref:tRNA (adenine(58)-N(1))-methyltransferase n=1 Tax=Helobdella robusta TaxID=6412 RepID=T1FSK3_HELRO|nr:hypothetical protein HELRODRAFT_191074 [Helobdella robusta]ESO07143.1 hypothetical protein HELRODRAFT_191074 [Helobdella robusta]
MSFSNYKLDVEYGDTVIIYIGYDNMLQFEVMKGKMHQTKYGAVKHDDLVGQSYGKKLLLSRGFVYLLHPTPELWTVTLKHRTQILYSTDISLIVYNLDLKPGSVVVESGTGSGSLSHSILRTITPGGCLHTFDFHELRSEIATKEFKSHGYDSKNVVCKHRDVCRDGFDLESVANAVFLDLPKPWLAVPFAKQSLIPGGRICSFSPCIEQVQKTCTALAANGFVAIETCECLNCPLEVRTMSLPIPDLGFSMVGHASESNKSLQVLSTTTITTTTGAVVATDDTTAGTDVEIMNKSCPVSINDDDDNNNVGDSNIDSSGRECNEDNSNEMQVDNEAKVGEHHNRAALTANVSTTAATTATINYNNNNESPIIISDYYVHSPPIGLITLDETTRKNKQRPQTHQRKLKHFKSDKREELFSDSKDIKLNSSSYHATLQQHGAKQITHNDHLKMNLTFKSCMPSLSRTGHTGYLTFATLYPC